MIRFTMQVAGQVAAISAMFDSTRSYCAEYICDAAADFEIRITQEDIAFERQKSEKEDRLEGRTPKTFTDAYLETIAVQRKLAEHLVSADVLLFHGSVVAVDGSAYLFTAKSGTGKSTHTRLWQEVFGSHAVMINDDKPFLKIELTGVTAFGSPWRGKHHLGSNRSAPLKAICILAPVMENKIRSITPSQALPMLLQQSYRPMDKQLLPKYMDLLDALSARVAFYHMTCNMDQQAALMAYEAMKG